MNRKSVKGWTGAAFGGLLAALGVGIVLSAGVSAQGTTPAASPPAAGSSMTAQGAMPNLNPATLPPGDAARGQALAGSAACTSCHGPKGVSTTPNFPRLAGQHPSYLTGQLMIFRAGIRKSQIMNRVAAKLSDQDISDLVAYFSAQKVSGAWNGQDPALAGEGAKLFAVGAPERGVIACAVCHGNAGQGNNELQIALVRHQSPAYTVDVLHEFQGLGTNGTPYSTAMYLEAKPLSDHELQALAAYIASMP